MEDTPTIAATRRFLAVIQDDLAPSDKQLARALDTLAMAYHEAPEGDPEDGDREPPSDYEDHKRRYAALGKRFPEFGYYLVADPTESVPTTAMVGDAIDDLADIAGDLEEVIWRFDNIGAGDAHWYFKFHYRAHWGSHLRELSHYLHAKIWISSDWDFT